MSVSVRGIHMHRKTHVGTVGANVAALDWDPTPTLFFLSFLSPVVLALLVLSCCSTCLSCSLYAR
jgi:hypothetical protein